MVVLSNVMRMRSMRYRGRYESVLGIHYTHTCTGQTRLRKCGKYIYLGFFLCASFGIVFAPKPSLDRAYGYWSGSSEALRDDASLSALRACLRLCTLYANDFHFQFCSIHVKACSQQTVLHRMDRELKERTKWICCCSECCQCQCQSNAGMCVCAPCPMNDFWICWRAVSIISIALHSVGMKCKHTNHHHMMWASSAICIQHTKKRERKKTMELLDTIFDVALRERECDGTPSYANLWQACATTFSAKYDVMRHH